MKAEDQLQRQLAARVTRLRTRVAALTAEIQLIERALADRKRGILDSSLKLRKNAVRKLNVQGQIRHMLVSANGPLRAKSLFEELGRSDQTLKSSTFRSHLKRMVDAGVIKQEGPRGHYRLVEIPFDDPKETEPLRRYRVRIPNNKTY